MRYRAGDAPRPLSGRRFGPPGLVRLVCSFVAFAAGLTATAVASAEPPAFALTPEPSSPSRGNLRQAKNFVGLGPLFGITGHTDDTISGALGFELSYVRYPVEAFGFGLGAFAQAQSVGFTHGRWAFGPQINFMMFGAEIGAYLEEGYGNRATTIGLHASPFVSIGFFSAALRIGVPVSAFSEGTPYGLDLGLICAIKAPIPLDGQLFGLAFH
ncbi:hypothetical protein [Polyangium jinanense]|uniref:Uncharacterized protein n=1 Tax=Polyangium jinanense TaxID=2829994 RepID=A0A9X3XEV7_9BACT|nr:hypothetical protein [Polyangium jinanense]MDC3987733.1 hypothetical protein [Polyangium jinanense]